MSKPTQKGELRDVKVNAISLVADPANGEKFKIFKSADTKKSDAGNLKTKLQDFSSALDTLIKTLVINPGNNGTSELETSPEKIQSALENFVNDTSKILINEDAKIEKTGRKISGARLSQLRNIKIMLDTILDELDPNEIEEDTGDLTGEDIAKSVSEAVKPLNERITQLEKNSFRDEIKKAVADAFQPLSDRLSRVENARGFSNKVPGDNTTIQKNNETFWGQIF